jgi:hypothetical protein
VEVGVGAGGCVDVGDGVEVGVGAGGRVDVGDGVRVGAGGGGVGGKINRAIRKRSA